MTFLEPIEPNLNLDITISAADNIDDALIAQYYDDEFLKTIVTATLTDIQQRIDKGLALPYFIDIDKDTWQQKPKALDIYVTDLIEGHALNQEARGKDYATNILSYPTDMPASIIEIMPILPLGELIICHDVIVREAAEQHKTMTQHLSHLLVHGILHLCGFDHETGQAEQDQMEQFEIDILSTLNLPNPYL